MKLSRSLWQTFKETPADAVLESHKLMIRAGLIHKSASGLYNLLPMGLRVVQKVSAIVREELDREGLQELAMTVLTPGELWEESGRFDKMGPEMLKALDRSERALCVSPTNEEAIVDIFRKLVTSYKQLPTALYQINTKFRDEIRPRYGVMRSREFIMKDAYSFHESKESLDETYDQLFEVYQRIFTRLGLKFIAVEADAGNIGDATAKTHEFQVLADSGEDIVLQCLNCEAASNIEKTNGERNGRCGLVSKDEGVTDVETPGVKTIQELCSFLKCAPHETLKALAYKATLSDSSEKNILCFVLGDDGLNEIKLKNLMKAKELRALRPGELLKLGLHPGFIGPMESNEFIEVFYDDAIPATESFIVGGNKTDLHKKGLVLSRDIKSPSFASLRMAKEGDGCKTCEKGSLIERKGIEVGHIFQLGDKYTKAMKVTVPDRQGRPMFPLMGCYGIGITRIVAAAIEQGHDDKGIIWPKAIAPYQVHFVVISKSGEFNDVIEKIYTDLKGEGIDVLLDDRKAGPGFKFKDAELLGAPLTLVFGERDYRENQKLEIRFRSGPEENISCSKDEILSLIRRKLIK